MFIALVLVAIAVVGIVAARQNARRRRAMARQRELGQQYQAQVAAPTVEAHSWGAADSQPPTFDAPGGLPGYCVPGVMRIPFAVPDPRSYDQAIGGQSTTIHSTLVTTFDHLEWSQNSSDSSYYLLGHTACAHLRLPVRAPFTWIVARADGPNSIDERLHPFASGSRDFDVVFAVLTTDPSFPATFLTPALLELALAESDLLTIVVAGVDVIVELRRPPTESAGPTRQRLADVITEGMHPSTTNPEFALRFVAGLLDRLPEDLSVSR